MILFPSAKINLGLHVRYKRPDGYHEIESCMVNIPLYDILEIIPSEKFSFTQSGITIEGNPEQNLCVKAYRLMQEQFDIPGVNMYLRKQIPMGAGMGGGSSDAAHVMTGLRNLFGISCSNEELETLAASLGSDCPFFINNSPKIASGRGEVLKNIDLDLKGFWLKVVYPGIHISTQVAYESIVPKDPLVNLENLIMGDISNWRESLMNDFEPGIFQKFPILAEIKSNMYDEGAIYAAMSGSGSTVFGIFESKPSFSYQGPENMERIVQF